MMKMTVRIFPYRWTRVVTVALGLLGTPVRVRYASLRWSVVYNQCVAVPSVPSKIPTICEARSAKGGDAHPCRSPVRAPATLREGVSRRAAVFSLSISVVMRSCDTETRNPMSIGCGLHKFSGKSSCSD